MNCQGLEVSGSFDLSFHTNHMEIIIIDLPLEVQDKTKVYSIGVRCCGAALMVNIQDESCVYNRAPPPPPPPYNNGFNVRSRTQEDPQAS